MPNRSRLIDGISKSSEDKLKEQVKKAISNALEGEYLKGLTDKEREIVKEVTGTEPMKEIIPVPLSAPSWTAQFINRLPWPGRIDPRGPRLIDSSSTNSTMADDLNEINRLIVDRSRIPAPLFGNTWRAFIGDKEIGDITGLDFFVQAPPPAPAPLKYERFVRYRPTRPEYPVGANMRLAMKTARAMAVQLQKLYGSQRLRLIGSGSSGLILASLVSGLGLDVVEIVAIRKKGEYSGHRFHHTAEYDGPALNVIIDDFAASGATLRHCYDSYLSDNESHEIQAIIVTKYIFTKKDQLRGMVVKDLICESVSEK